MEQATTKPSPPLLGKAIRECGACPLSGAGSGRCPFSRTSVPARTVLCNQGEVHATAYLVREGIVTESAVDAEGLEAGLTVRGPGSLLGLEGLSGALSPHALRALGPLQLCALSIPSLQRWLGDDASPARALVGLLLQELGRRQEDLSWQRGDALSRVARLLLALGPAPASALQKQLSARLLAMRPETLSRCLRKLAALGLVRLSESRTVVLDPVALAAVASGGATGSSGLI